MFDIRCQRRRKKFARAPMEVNCTAKKGGKNVNIHIFIIFKKCLQSQSKSKQGRNIELLFIHY
jgi:hypothetical protein